MSTDIESNWTGGITGGADAMRRRRDIYGSILRFPLGETIQQDNGGGLIVKDINGKIIKTIDRFENETSYHWNNGGEMIRVDLPERKSYARIENDEWVLVHPDHIIEKSGMQFSVLADGTLRIACTTVGGTRYFKDSVLDGTTLIINEFGRITLVTADLDVQTERLYSVLDSFQRERHINFDQRQSVCDAYHALLRRVSLEEITQEQAAEVVFHVCRLLESCCTSVLGGKICFMMCRELLHFSALPDEVKASDGLSMLIRQLYRRHPEQVANLIADIGISQSYVTMSGTIVEYVDELMHPTVRRMNEWSVAQDSDSLVESHRFLRVVLVNILSRARMDGIAHASSSVTTREYGRVRPKDLADLYEQVTGARGAGLSFKGIDETDVLERSISFRRGHNSSSEVA